MRCAWGHSTKESRTCLCSRLASLRGPLPHARLRLQVDIITSACPHVLAGPQQLTTAWVCISMSTSLCQKITISKSICVCVLLMSHVCAFGYLNLYIHVLCLWTRPLCLCLCSYVHIESYRPEQPPGLRSTEEDCRAPQAETHELHNPVVWSLPKNCTKHIWVLCELCACHYAHMSI